MPILTREKDVRHQQEVAAMMSRKWGCTVKETGYMDTWDFVGMNDGRTVFIAELKTRAVPSDLYETVYLSAHKWLQLSYASAAMKIGALFIVRFDDVVMWQRMAQIDARDHELAGRFDRPDQVNDQELIIHVPIREMKVLWRLEDWNE